jgi:hypothetical protein
MSTSSSDGTSPNASFGATKLSKKEIVVFHSDHILLNTCRRRGGRKKVTFATQREEREVEPCQGLFSNWSMAILRRRRQ